MPNRLARETSPYLLQHRDNPVDWYPWGDEALARAREEDRPILLSVGYSACHWCHVMERESFEDPETAAYMNEHFVNVKVDREERPDVDALYMEAVQAMTGHGGWPMTVFLRPGGRPLLRRHLLPARRRARHAELPDGDGSGGRRLRAETRRAAGAGAGDAGAARRDRARSSRRPSRPAAACWRRRSRRCAPAPTWSAAASAARRSSRPPRRWSCCSPAAVTEIVETTLDAMLAGGIYDQIGGGFSRYSVDAAWLVPHFEKMLYDNALLARAYLHGWQALGHERYRRVCEETLDWALREMRGPEGGFYSALDADSEGEEGRFYVWTPEEIREVLGDAAQGVIDYYGVTERGNFEGRNILHLAGGGTAPAPDGLGSARRALDEARSKRVRPGLDDKRLTSWNALAIAALAEAGAVLERDDYLDAARGCADFVLDKLRNPDGNLLRTYKDGEARLNAYLEDHAFLLEALLTLYESTFEQRWFEAGPGPGRHHDRPLRRPRARRLLLHLQRPRGPDSPPQGDQETTQSPQATPQQQWACSAYQP